MNDASANLREAIETSQHETSPSTLSAVATILEVVPLINGAPQNTSAPGYITLAEGKCSFVGDDPKSGRAKVKSVLAEFLVNTGIKPLFISSHNHLGNNDGHHLNSQAQFKNKEILKRSVVADSIHLLFMAYKSVGEKEGECLIMMGGQKMSY